jgi:hypothetical protein
MLSLRVLCLLLIAPGVIRAQGNPQKLDSSPNNPDVAAELKALREALLETQKQVASQQREIETLKERSKADQVVATRYELQPSAAEPANAMAIDPTPGAAGNLLSSNDVRVPMVQQEKEKESPLSFKIGSATFTPGGFVDIENIFRTTNTQNNIATNFAAIPFSNTPQGNLTEYRLTAQFSRFTMTVRDKFGANDMTGYCEADFSGNDATNVYQTVNGHTLRVRLCFLNLKRGKWEVLGGQTWSWLTPNRKGVGGMPSDDLWITYNEDQNIAAGFPYTRAAEFRVAYHLNDHWAMGLAIEDPNQFIGGFVALPEAFSTTLSPQFDNGAQIGAPNLFPDILPKIAYDTEIGSKHFHVEAVGLLTGARSTVVPIGGTTFNPHSAVGGGGQISTNFQLTRNLTFLAVGFWSDGGARYLVADGPQLVLRPNVAGTDVSPSMVHAGAGTAGFEWNANQRTTLAVYYGADYFGRNFFPDTTNTAHPETIIGYGGPGSANTNNRAIQQATMDWIQIFWKNPKYGALQYYTQYSYLTRAPWFVAASAPKNAHLSMVYAGIRYVLPSTLDFDSYK